MAKLTGQEAEEIDTAEGKDEARRLVREYSVAFGPEWRIWKTWNRSQE